MNILEAIAKMEGFYKEGSRPQRNNNPGDLEYHKWMNMLGATHGDPRFAVFPTAEDGFNALAHLLGFGIYKGLTLREAINKFAPPVENDTNHYIRMICGWTNLLPDSLLADALEQVQNESKSS